MPATTIKLDGALIGRLKTIKPRHETLTGFVRTVLDAEVRRQQLRAAAETYADHLRDHPEEAELMDSWASAPLEHAPKPRRKRPR